AAAAQLDGRQRPDPARGAVRAESHHPGARQGSQEGGVAQGAALASGQGEEGELLAHHEGRTVALLRRAGAEPRLQVGADGAGWPAPLPLGHRGADALYDADPHRAARGERDRLGALPPRASVPHRAAAGLPRVRARVARVLPRSRQGAGARLRAIDRDHVRGAGDRDRSDLRGSRLSEGRHPWPRPTSSPATTRSRIPRRSPPTRRSPAPRSRREAGASSCAACRRRPTRTGSTSARWWWNSTVSSALSPLMTAPATRKRWACSATPPSATCASSKASAERSADELEEIRQ